MIDILTREGRSQRMSRIRGQDTAPEIALRHALHAKGLRYRLHPSGLPGKPDLVLPRWRAVVFVHGCYWHAHKNCRIANLPESNRDFWCHKFAANRQRDARVIRELRRLGWRVALVWECEMSTKSRLAATVARISRVVTRSPPSAADKA